MAAPKAATLHANRHLGKGKKKGKGMGKRKGKGKEELSFPQGSSSDLQWTWSRAARTTARRHTRADGAVCLPPGSQTHQEDLFW